MSADDSTAPKVFRLGSLLRAEDSVAYCLEIDLRAKNISGELMETEAPERGCYDLLRVAPGHIRRPQEIHAADNRGQPGNNGQLQVACAYSGRNILDAKPRAPALLERRLVVEMLRQS